MEDDRFLKEYGREPRPEFARALRERLRGQEQVPEARRRFLFQPAFAAAAVVILIAVAFSIPAVRVSAQALLDLFRVRNFAAVPFDEARMEKLHSLEQDNAMLVFDKRDVMEPGKPQVVASPEAAAALAGIPVQTPAWLPEGFALDTIQVQGAGEARLTVNGARLRAVLDALDLRDVVVPAAVDGQTLRVRMSPAVTENFVNGERRIHLIQARSPEVELPAGVNLEELGEIGLRILGLDPGEARRMARSIDWHSTLVVPVPANATEFRQVTVRGNPGLLVSTNGQSVRTHGGRKSRSGSILLWTEGDRVFALGGNRDALDLIQVAESLR